jgi:hypothetical protein
VFIELCANRPFVERFTTVDEVAKRHHNARQTRPALTRLKALERCLNGVNPGFGDALDGGDGAAGHRPDGCVTSWNESTVDLDPACSALIEAAAKSRAAHTETVAQHIEQWFVAEGADLDWFAVQDETKSGFVTHQ